MTIGATPAHVSDREPARPAAGLGIDALLAAYRSGDVTPRKVIADVLDTIATGDPAVWIDRLDEADLRARCEELACIPDGPTRLPLYGVPFAVKDNIDVAGLPTTAGCPDFSTVARESAPAVALLERAGAIPVGKTNLDQFATGLVGTRSPYGIPRNPHAPDHIPGGSSSGSAVAVAGGLVSFALGTDTAGSGRVPAAMTGIVGLKPTRGLVSTRGVVPACRSLDCVSVFATNANDAAAVLAVLDEHDPQDVYNLSPGERNLRRPDELSALRVGVPVLGGIEPAIAEAFDAHVGGLAGLGVEIVPIDLWPFEAAGKFLYDGPWLAERLAGVGDFALEHPDALLDVTRQVLSGGQDYTAIDLFRSMEELAGLRRQADNVFARVDVIALPSVPTLTTLDEVAADPVGSNARLGQFTNFVNLLDLAAVAVPAGFVDWVPVGFTLLGPALTDLTLVGLASAYLGADATPAPAVPEPVHLAVAGAHLRGEPLHHQLINGRARLVGRTTTAPIYRLFALDGDGPAKPALVPSADGVEVEVEVYELPATYVQVLREAATGPLTISAITLRDGSQVAGYRTATDDAPAGRDISRFGSWRAYLGSRETPATDEPAPKPGRNDVQH
ncbi:MAG TPA: allophanate hydrolase [Nitriliruptorales bacterium]|nr:allophanate hydrolase [Nitriliruptorales bacterium]